MTAEIIDRVCSRCSQPCLVVSLDDAPCDCSCHAGRRSPCRSVDKGPIYGIFQKCQECGGDVLGRWTPDGADPPPASCSQHS